MREIIGYKGKSGSGGGGGTETPDSLHSISYAKVLDLVSEGEIQGLVDGMKSVYFNETPLQNADGTYNFKGATVDFRPGTQVQDPIDGFPDVSNEIGVGIELKSSSPWTKSLSNTQLTSISIRLGINALTKADTSNGNINGYTVAYKIELSTDGGAYDVVVDTAFSGKTTSQYQRSHRIKLPKAMTGWTVRVVRITPNANSSTVADTTTILTYTELIDARMRYPMSAVVGVQIDASQFQSIPTRAYDLYGRILSVPSNYDPVARTYSGIWNGTFKPAWTNNPAWIFYDLLINGRYGLGNLIPSSYVDKWGLYQIAQYCDQIVPDGHGGTEPRFTCNLYLQSAAEAYKVLQDLAALFRGITYWAGGTIVASADMPQDPTYIFTAANVIDGKFHNTGSSKKTRYTVAVVSWNDPANFYKPKAEYVQDDEGLIRYGVQQLNLTAFGCTSQGQAQRAGKWALLTSRLETDVVTFGVALDALVVAPGQVVRIANPNKAGRRNGGRIRAAVGRVVTLDKAPVIAAGDTLSVILPTGISETKIVSSVSGNDVTVDSDWSVMPQAPAIWSVDSANLVAPTYRIISITQKDSFSFEISAIRHEPGKFGYIDNGTKIQRQPVTLLATIPNAPTNLMFSSNTYWVDPSLSATDGILSWFGQSPKYIVTWRREDGSWTTDTVQTSSYEIKGMLAGSYSFTVTAVSATGTKSQTVDFNAQVSPGGGSVVAPSLGLTTTSKVFGIDVAWTVDDATMLHLSASEIWYSKSTQIANAVKLASISAPQVSFSLTGLAAGDEYYFWVRLIDKRNSISDFYPTGAGIRGVSSTDAKNILDYLNGKISKTQLAIDLLKPIDDIKEIDTRLIDIETAIVNIPDGSALQSLVSRQENSIRDGEAMAALHLIAFSDADKSIAVTRSETSAKYAENLAQITDLQQVVTDSNQALSQRVTTMKSAYDDNFAAIQTKQETLATSQLAQASKVEVLQVRMGEATASIQSEITARATADSAQASRIDTLAVKVDQNTAAIQNEQYVRATADSAQAGRIDTLTVKVDQNTAAIQTESNARADALGSLAVKVDTVTAKANDTSATVQNVSTAVASINGDLSAMQTIKTQIVTGGRTIIAGIGVGVNSKNGVTESQVLLSAQRVAIIDESSGTLQTPFVVQGGQVFINQAFIGDAYVDTLKIAGNAVSIPVGMSAASYTASVTVSLDGDYPVFVQASLTQALVSIITLTRDGNYIWSEQPIVGTLASRGVLDRPGPGIHTYKIESSNTGNTNGASIFVLVVKR